MPPLLQLPCCESCAPSSMTGFPMTGPGVSGLGTCTPLFQGQPLLGQPDTGDPGQGYYAPLFHNKPTQGRAGPGKPGQGRSAILPQLSSLGRPSYGVPDQRRCTQSSTADLPRACQALSSQAGEDVPNIPLLPGQGNCTPSSMAGIPRASQALSSQASDTAPPLPQPASPRW